MARLVTLGFLRVQGSEFRQPKALVLLSFLALEGAKERRYLAELFWPGAVNPMGNLATSLTRLRQGSGSVEADDVRAWSTLTCDAAEFLACLECGAIEEALGLYQGRFLDGVHLRDWGAELEEWVYGTREYLAGLAREALLAVAEVDLARGRVKEAAGRAEAAYLLSGAPEPEPEDYSRFYALLHAGGNPRAAEVRRDAESFGITLTPPESPPVRPEVPAGEVGFGVASLPMPGTSFVGRDVESLQLVELLADPECRLVTLHGPGGVGKTRLAIRVAGEHSGGERFPDGVYFTALESLAEAADIVTGIASSMGLDLRSTIEPLALVKRSIGSKRLLLVLDNFEHLMDGAVVASELVQSCPNLKLLVTSRERLNLAEEMVFTVEGLPIPGAELPDEELHAMDAVQLFSKRAKSADLSFSLTPETLPGVLDVCRLVWGSPLGIELAAVWVKVLSSGEIAREIARNLDFLETPIRNVPGRHHSIRATFEHSWALLTASEQRVFRKLAVFRGGFRRDAASVVAGATIPVLASLVDKSFLRVLPGGRYDRHVLLYQYAQEKLAEHPAEQTEVRSSHGWYFVLLAEETETTGRYLDRLVEENDNLRAALAWAVGGIQVEEALRFGGALWHLWNTLGHYQEGRDWITQVLALPGAAGRTALRAKALRSLGLLHYRMSDYPQAQVHMQESHGISKELGDERGVAEALAGLGRVSLGRSHHARARELYRQSLTLFQELGDERGVVEALAQLGITEFYLNDYVKALTLLREVREERREAASETLVTMVTHNLGLVLMQQANYPAAKRHFEEALELQQKVGDVGMLTMVIFNLGNIAFRMSDYPDAGRRYEEALKMMVEIGDRWHTGYVLNNLGNLALVQGDLAGARTWYEQSMAVRREIGNDQQIAGSLIKFGNLAYQEGDVAQAESLFRESLVTARKLADSVTISHALNGWGLIAFDAGEFGKAGELIGESLALMQDGSDKSGMALALTHLGMVACAEGDYPSAHTHLEQALQIRIKINERLGMAESLEGLAELAVAEGNPEWAARLYGAASGVRESLGAPLLPSDKIRYDQAVSKIRSQLGEVGFVDAWTVGKTLPLERILESIAGSPSTR